MLGRIGRQPQKTSRIGRQRPTVGQLLKLVANQIVNHHNERGVRVEKVKGKRSIDGEHSPRRELFVHLTLDHLQIRQSLLCAQKHGARLKVERIEQFLQSSLQRLLFRSDFANQKGGIKDGRHESVHVEYGEVDDVNGRRLKSDRNHKVNAGRAKQTKVEDEDQRTERTLNLASNLNVMLASIPEHFEIDRQ